MRIDLDILQSWIAPSSRVLDLGCGSGSLLSKLVVEKNITGYGIEIDQEKITRCIEKRVNVIEQDLDAGLKNFADGSFDTVVMSQTLQAVRYPHLVLDEMLRVGKECIVTFPNFGHWKARFHLFTHGRMPVSDLLPYEWYDTPNIHFCTFKDFEVLCHERQIKVIHRQVVNESSQSLFKDIMPNLFGETAIYHLSKS